MNGEFTVYVIMLQVEYINLVLKIQSRFGRDLCWVFSLERLTNACTRQKG